MRALWEALLAAVIQPKVKKLEEDRDKFLSWRLAVETNNMLPWQQIPAWCIPHLERYMLGGQYQSDVDMAVDQILAYASTAAPAADRTEAWVLDVDDTCLSNVPYFQQGKFGVLPFDAMEFKAWVQKGACPAIPGVLRLYKKLIAAGFKVLLITNREEDEHGPATIRNLDAVGFVGYERIIMRTENNKGQSSQAYKRAIRKALVEEGFQIRGNVGDQWSDLTGDYAGERGFKLPNPVYFVP